MGKDWEHEAGVAYATVSAHDLDRTLVQGIRSLDGFMRIYRSPEAAEIRHRPLGMEGLVILEVDLDGVPAERFDRLAPDRQFMMINPPLRPEGETYLTGDIEPGRLSVWEPPALAL